ncbi:MAG: (Fe-S)-binding protein [candidate division KSB1 bacterium]|nr:(Fe-S)-binding protein [candidate division KSB1 bacterium]
MDAISDIIKRTKAYYCLDCGKCTGSCPVSRVNRTYSPRALLMKTIQNDHNGVLKDKNLWECLTCAMCEERCPSAIRYIEFTRDMRIVAHGQGGRGECSHGGAFQSLMRIQTTPHLKQNRLDWVTSDLKISTTKGEVLYFVGCLPYFDAFFTDLEVRTLDSARGVVKILNALKIQPVVMPNERCCGHDLLWSGDVENFKRLAQHNLNEIAKIGAKTVIFSCPEGYRTFKEDYPRHFGKLGFEVRHISEFLAPKIAAGQISFNGFNGKVTYQDPCRLGRHLGIYDPPRQVMKAMSGLELTDMRHSRNTSVCCGVGNWMGCNAFTKQLQVNRLKEAKATGADLLITACPKCEIHLKCALHDEKVGQEIQMEIRDLMALAASRLV